MSYSRNLLNGVPYFVSFVLSFRRFSSPPYSCSCTFHHGFNLFLEAQFRVLLGEQKARQNVHRSGTRAEDASDLDRQWTVKVS
jgi:hypothetical protein